MEPEIQKQNLASKLKSFILKCRRVFKITKKPSKEEFKVITKITGIGIMLIGTIGFLIYLAWKLVEGI